MHDDYDLTVLGCKIKKTVRARRFLGFHLNCSAKAASNAGLTSLEAGPNPELSKRRKSRHVWRAPFYRACKCDEPLLEQTGEKHKFNAKFGKWQ
jgi:hypothetical protein